jgi:hypothetical protein
VFLHSTFAAFPFVRFSYFNMILASFWSQFYLLKLPCLWYVLCSLSRFTVSGLWLGMVVSVCTCWFHNMVTLNSGLGSTNFGTCSYQRLLCNFTHISLHLLKCSWIQICIIIINIIIIIITVLSMNSLGRGKPWLGSY